MIWYKKVIIIFLSHVGSFYPLVQLPSAIFCFTLNSLNEWQKCECSIVQKSKKYFDNTYYRLFGNEREFLSIKTMAKNSLSFPNSLYIAWNNSVIEDLLRLNSINKLFLKYRCKIIYNKCVLQKILYCKKRK